MKSVATFRSIDSDIAIKIKTKLHVYTTILYTSFWCLLYFNVLSFSTWKIIERTIHVVIAKYVDKFNSV